MAAGQPTSAFVAAIYAALRLPRGACDDVDSRSHDGAMMATDSDEGVRIYWLPCKLLIPPGSNIEGTGCCTSKPRRPVHPFAGRRRAPSHRSRRPAASPLGRPKSGVKSVIAAPGSARHRKQVAGKAPTSRPSGPQMPRRPCPVVPSIMRSADLLMNTFPRLRARKIPIRFGAMQSLSRLLRDPCGVLRFAARSERPESSSWLV
jgi:hypothetical protein